MKLQLEELEARLQAQKLDITIKLERGAAKAIARVSWSPAEGARGIRRFIQERVENYLSDKLLAQTSKQPTTVTVKVKDNEVVVE